MKRIIITADERATVSQRTSLSRLQKEIVVEGSEVTASDGYHTFDELYDHRITLYVTLCRFIVAWYEILDVDSRPEEADVWRAKLHNDGSGFEGWYVLGIGRIPGHQITYHLPLSRWNETDFVGEEQTFEKAPCEFDGHAPDDVLKRLKEMFVSPVI